MGKGLKFFVGSVVVLIALIVFITSQNDSGKEKRGEALTLYCAAGIKPAVMPVAKEYERVFGKEVKLMYGGSGTLLSNIDVSKTGDLYIAEITAMLRRRRLRGMFRNLFHSLT